MKFKNYYPAIFILCIFSGTVRGQSTDSRFYIKAYGGYGFSTPGSENFTNSKSTYDGMGHTTTNYSVTSGLGKGFHYGGGVGYIINDFINVGIDADYLKSTTIKASGSYTSRTAGGDDDGINTLEVPNSVLSIIPNITFKAFSKPSYYIYTRIGIIVSVDTKLQENTYDSSVFHSVGGVAYNINSQTHVYAFSTNLGLQASVGVQFRLSGKLRAFTELVGYFLPANPSSLKRTTEVNYYDEGGPPPVYTKIIGTVNYSKSSLWSNAASPQTGTGTKDDPYLVQYTEDDPSSTKNINYLGINVGLVFRL